MGTLQIQSDGASTTQKEKLLGKLHEQIRTEEKNTKENMATLETGVKEIRHEQSKLKDNVRAWMEIHGQQMLALMEGVAQESKTTNALEEKLNEIEKLHNEQARKAAEIPETDIAKLQGTVKERRQETI